MIRVAAIVAAWAGESMAPAAQVDQYTKHQKRAFLKAFNAAWEQYGHDESRALAIAHAAAKKAGAKPG
jgi:cation transport regulator